MSSKIKFPKNISDYWDIANTPECSLWAWGTTQPKEKMIELFEKLHPEYPIKDMKMKDADPLFVFICKVGYLYQCRDDFN